MSKQLLILVLSLYLVVVVLGHGFMYSPWARTGSQDDERVAPCGNTAPAESIQARWISGDIVTIGWIVDIDSDDLAANGSAGYVSFAMSQGGSQPTDFNIAINGYFPISYPGNYTAQIIVPNVNCNDCVLQWTWTPGNVSLSPYYSCADVRVAPVGPPLTTPNGLAVTPTPSILILFFAILLISSVLFLQ